MGELGNGWGGRPKQAQGRDWGSVGDQRSRQGPQGEDLGIGGQALSGGAIGGIRDAGGIC